MKCPNCGASCANDYNLCPYCGADLGEVIDADDVYEKIDNMDDKLDDINSKLNSSNKYESGQHNRSYPAEPSGMEKAARTIFFVVFFIILFIILIQAVRMCNMPFGGFGVMY